MPRLGLKWCIAEILAGLAYVWPSVCVCTSGKAYICRVVWGGRGVGWTEGVRRGRRGQTIPSSHELPEG